MPRTDYYELLGISRTASPDEIRGAYMRARRKFHPDVSQEPDAQERFKQVQKAYEVLHDSDKRAAYERYGEDWQHSPANRFHEQWEQHAGAQSNGPDDGFAFRKFLNAIFNRETDPFAAAPHHRAHGPDLTVSLEITLEEAFAGSHRAIVLEVPELNEDGLVRLRRKTLNVRIPAGIHEEQKIRLGGQGHPGLAGGLPGDLHLAVRIAPHRLFSVDGRNVQLRLPVAPWEAALGATVTVPTLNGKVNLKVPAGTQSGARLRLKGRGLPAKEPGDQLVEIQIVVPPAQSASARSLYGQMQADLGFEPRRHLGE